MRHWTMPTISGIPVTRGPDLLVALQQTHLSPLLRGGDGGGLAGIEGAELDFGQPYTGRPSALKGYYKYTPGVIDQAKAPYDALMGQTDSCHIYIGLFDWSAPFRVNTTTVKKEVIEVFYFE